MYCILSFVTGKGTKGHINKNKGISKKGKKAGKGKGRKQEAAHSDISDNLTDTSAYSDGDNSDDDLFAPKSKSGPSK